MRLVDKVPETGPQKEELLSDRSTADSALPIYAADLNRHDNYGPSGP
jgi:hypothetical protein